MKKMIYTIGLAFMMLIAGSAFSQQDTIIAFTFPSGSADSLADAGLSINLSRYLSCEYGTWGEPTWQNIPIDYTTNGSLGSPDKCAKVTGLDNGADSVFFMMKFKTTGYHNLKLYSKQTAGGNNPGPKDFKAQYKLSGSTSPWIDIPNGVIVCANDWTTGVLDGIDLPAACNDQSSNVSVRWLQTSNLDINGNPVQASGISKIDDIIVMGEAITGFNNILLAENVSIYPNPSQGAFYIECNDEIANVKIFNILGKTIYTQEQIQDNVLKINDFDKGIYMVQFTKKDNTSFSSKLIVK